MKPVDYLEAAKKALGLPSDYALAKVMGIDRGRLHKLKTGTRPMDTAEMLWLATTLEADPGLVVADLAEQREKNKAKKDFLRGFLSRAAIVAVLCVTLVSSFTDGVGSVLAAAGGGRRRSYA